MNGLHPLVEQLQRLRIEQGLSIREVERRMGVNGAVSAAERGHRVPALSTVTQWAAVLGWELALFPSRTPLPPSEQITERRRRELECALAGQPDDPEERTCTWCGQTKPVTEFSAIDRTGRLRPNCRTCHLGAQKRQKLDRLQRQRTAQPRARKRTPLVTTS